jgi:hypothetical protein
MTRRRPALLAWIERHATAVQAFTGILTMLVAIAALFGVKAQIDASARLQREQSARDIYREYLSLTVARPEFARPDYCAIADGPQEAAYEAYVDYLLYTAEQAISADPGWRISFARQLDNHQLYLCATDDWSDYSPAVVDLIDAARGRCERAPLTTCR